MKTIDLRHSRLFSGGTEKKQENFSQDSWCPGRYSNWAPPEYKLRHIQMHLQSITENCVRNGTAKRAYDLWVFGFNGRCVGLSNLSVRSQGNSLYRHNWSLTQNLNIFK
jgi:hypothetical protein